METKVNEKGTYKKSAEERDLLDFIIYYQECNVSKGNFDEFDKVIEDVRYKLLCLDGCFDKELKFNLEGVCPMDSITIQVNKENIDFFDIRVEDIKSIINHYIKKDKISIIIISLH